MALADVFEKLGRAVFESPFETKRLARDAPELAEIRLAALDAIKAKSHRIGGKNVFPFELVRIQLLGIPLEQEAVFRSSFIAKYFSDELKAALARTSYRFPEDLQVEFVSTPRLPAAGESWLSVETLMRPVTEEAIVSAARVAVLTVHSGTANHPRMVLAKARTNIGRTVEVFRGGAPSRLNDLAFVGDDEADRSVSREHAHVNREPNPGSTKEPGYRLFNDRNYRGDGNCGLWIVRDGMSYPVHRSTRGTPLESGDEIHLGTARLRFLLESSEPVPEDK